MEGGAETPLMCSASILAQSVEVGKSALSILAQNVESASNSGRWDEYLFNTPRQAERYVMGSINNPSSLSPRIMDLLLFLSSFLKIPILLPRSPSDQVPPLETQYHLCHNLEFDQQATETFHNKFCVFASSFYLLR